VTFAFLFIVYQILFRLLSRPPRRMFSTLIVLILFLGGVQLLCLAIIGSYIAHIYDEVKRRPPFVARASSISRKKSAEKREEEADERRLILHPTKCAICGTTEGATELYPSNLNWRRQSARFLRARLPDRIHYRMVKCDACGLVRSDPVVDWETLARLYASSTFDYGTEVEGLKRTYGGYLSKLDRWSIPRIRCWRSAAERLLFEEALAAGTGPCAAWSRARRPFPRRMRMCATPSCAR